jgi:medium-chain acyl-[acyl-carrier-protein] hydrolase
MSTVSTIWTESIRIHSYDVDWHQQSTLESLCRSFLDAAWNHAEQLGVGYSHLEHQNQFWVLSRLLMKVHDYPKWGQTVTLRTWPRGAKTIFALRDFEMVDSAGAVCVAGTSSWLILDLNSKRPQRVERLLSSMQNVCDRSAVGGDAGKVAALEIGQPAYQTCVGYSDIDVNRHVTSARYVGWLMDSYPFEFHHEHRATVLEVNYVGETLCGDAVTVRSESKGTCQFGHLITKNGGEEVCRARLEWNVTQP